MRIATVPCAWAQASPKEKRAAISASLQSARSAAEASRAPARAVRVRRPRPNLRLVEIDMRIDEAGPHQPAVQIDGVRCAAKGSERGNAAARDAKIEADETFRIGWPERSS